MAVQALEEQMKYSSLAWGTTKIITYLFMTFQFKIKATFKLPLEHIGKMSVSVCLSLAISLPHLFPNCPTSSCQEGLRAFALTTQ